MLAPFATRPSTMALPATVAALTVAMAVAFVAFGMSGRDLRAVGLYLLLSGSLSLALGLGALRLGFGRGLGIRNKMGLAGAMGSLVALANVLVTAVLMFLSSHDLSLLVVLAVSH